MVVVDGDVEGSRGLFRSTRHKNVGKNRESSYQNIFELQFSKRMACNHFRKLLLMFPPAVGSNNDFSLEK